MIESESGSETVEIVVEARKREVAGFSVRRSLPTIHRRSVGPFVFVDHFGPISFPPGRSMDVLPHPHIGLSTVTYLFEGEIIHRDSIGSRQSIRPGDLNWMTAGRGIAHSERGTEEQHARGGRSHGLQLWVGLPSANEELAPSFAHHPQSTLPKITREAADLTLIAGEAYGSRSPAVVSSPLFYVDARLRRGQLELPNEHEERAAYVVEGSVTVDGRTFESGNLIVFRPTKQAILNNTENAHVMLLGGARLDGPRFMWWNFVSSRKERIEQAKQEWKEGLFSKVVGDETEFVPLPEH